MTIYTEDDVRELLLKKAKGCGLRQGATGVNQWCKKHGVFTTSTSAFIHGKIPPSTKLLDALGLERRIVKKGRK
jgi:hypothetical protein